MPRYDYHCAGCGWTGPLIVALARRDEQHCPGCTGPIVREEIALTGPPNAKGGYQMHGIFGPQGQHVPGHFGKDAKRRRKP